MGSYTVGAFINFVLNFFFLRGSLSLESSTGGMAYSAHSSHSDDVLSEPGSLEPFESLYFPLAGLYRRRKRASLLLLCPSPKTILAPQ